MSTGDSSEGQPAIEELGDTNRLVGGWGAEGDTEQGEVIQWIPMHGHTHESTPTTTTMFKYVCTYVHTYLNSWAETSSINM